MNFRRLSIIALLMASPFCLGQQPAKNSEAAAVGMNGPVHTVLTEGTSYLDNPRGAPMWSVLVVYDPKGYTLEEYRYEPIGALSSHTKYTRNEWRVFKVETTSVLPNENHTFVQHFNAGGLVTGTENYGGTGALLQKTHNEFAVKQGGATTSTTETTNADGTVTVDKTVETIDPKTGTSHQSRTRDGIPLSEWVIQQAAKGNREADRLKSIDGSFSRREVKPDGTTVEHSYWAPAKTHTYQTTDPRGHITEVIDISPSSYTRTTFRYDEQGRCIDLINYDRSGKRFGEEIDKYQDDGYGNWIEQKELVWDPEMGSKPPKIATVTRRTITYY